MFKGIKKFFSSKKNTVQEKNTDQKAEDVVIRLMPADKEAFDGVNKENLYRISVIQHTLRGQSMQKRLVPCRVVSLKELLVGMKKNQLDVYYISLQPFCIECRNKTGARVKYTVQVNPDSDQFVSWIQLKVKNRGEAVASEKFAEYFDNKDLPNWLRVLEEEQIAEVVPEPEKEPEVDVKRVEDIVPGAVLFNQYRIERELGEGGMGKVFLATDTQTTIESRRNVVLKVLHIENAHDEKSQAQFMKEAETLAGLQNERIAACYNSLMYGDVPILIMEYVKGKSLDKYLIEHDGVISEAATKELLLPIAEALDYAHKRNIYHLDVKPQNIIVRENPRAGIKTCLLDFGIARKNHADGTFTYTMVVSGTPQYMSPDQRLNEPPSAAMDIYSLAVTAYECIAGDLPYPQGYTRTVKVKELSPKTPFTQSIMKGIDENPGERPATCVQLINPPIPPKPPKLPPSKPNPSPLKPAKPPVVPEIIIDEPPVDISSPLTDLKKSIENYRRMLAESANKIAGKDSEFADYFRGEQARLRDLTKNLDEADEDKLAAFFNEIREKIIKSESSPDEFFVATDRLVELRAGLPKAGGVVWSAMRASIT